MGIPHEVYNDDQSINCNKDEVLAHWKGEFDKLYNSSVVEERDNDFDNYVKDYLLMRERIMKDPLYEGNTELNANISEFEIRSILRGLKLKKSVGHDRLPNEVLRCEVLVPLYQQLFQFIFDTGLVPTEWYMTLVQPIKTQKVIHGYPTTIGE